jgi:flagellar motor switch protein FliG
MIAPPAPSSLQDQAPAVAEEVNRFRVTFEDLLALDGRSLQRVLREVDADTLRLAMKGLDADRQQVIFSNMSERAAVRLREELENSGPTRLRDVETAQQSIVGIARGLQEKGELQIGSGSGAANEEEESFV